MRRLKPIAIVCAAALAGCASIVGDRNQLISLQSAPDQANVVVIDETGQRAFSGTTPTTVLLKKSDGTYFGGKSYQVRVEKPGYKPLDLRLETRANGWYLAGNLLFGGLIGWFIVDPMTGAMYTITPETVSASLEGSVQADDGRLSLVLLEDVPASMRDRLEPVRF